MNKRGFTLMELLVYMAVVGIVVLIAGQAFNDSTKMRVRTQSMIEANQVAENIANIIKDDVSQMGAKSAYNLSGSTDLGGSFAVKSGVYMDPSADSPDSSSFNLKKGADHTDSLIMRRVGYDNQGNYARVEEIIWYVEDGSLYRSCKTIDGTESDECGKTHGDGVVVAEGVSKFEFTPARPGVLSSDYSTTSGKQFPRLLPSNTDVTVEAFKLVPRTDAENDFFWATTDPANGGTSVKISGFASNYDYENQAINLTGKRANQLFVATAEASTSSWKDQCIEIDSLEIGVEYEISFSMPYSSDDIKSFCPGKDHMSVGFRKKSDGSAISEIDDFLFFPPQAADAGSNRQFRFSVSKTVKKVCMAFTFVTYSPVVGQGSITIENLQLNRVETSNYKFEEGFNPANVVDKKKVKAFKLDLTVKKNKESGTISLVIPTSGNGPRD